MSGFGTRPTAAPIPVDANRRALAEALMGLPARVGQAFTGMANAGLQANEAFMQGRGQDGEDLYARPFLPGADTGGRLGALASFVGSNMAMGGPAGSLGAGPSMPSRGIRAYHGSPHDFDRFDLSKIGTGEGAQAYGHGLYFAENPSIAQGYKVRVSNQVANDPAFWAGKPLPSSLSRAEFSELNALGMRMRQNGNLPAEEMARWQALKNIDAQYNDAILAAKPIGRMYEVNINARPDQFLDWDAPLSRQGQSVQDALKKFGYEYDGPAMRQYDDALLNALAGDANAPLPKQPQNPLGANIYESSKIVPGGYRDPAQASQILRDAGIPGIRYLDQGSRATGEGTRNYVVFDDKLIDILRKYGLAGLAAGGVGMAADGEAQANPLAGALLGYQPQE